MVKLSFKSYQNALYFIVSELRRFTMVHENIGSTYVYVNFLQLSYSGPKNCVNLNSVLLLARIDRQNVWLHCYILVSMSAHK